MNNNENVIKILNGSRRIKNGKKIKVFTLLTTCPKGSGNVGDKLITESLKSIIIDIYKRNYEIYFLEYFRKDKLDTQISLINRTNGIILCAFPIRSNMYGEIYGLVGNLNNLSVKFIPIGSGECTRPGYKNNIISKKYETKDLDFIKYIQRNSNYGIGCRDNLVMKQLIRNNIKKVTMVGDCAWYDIKSIGKPLNFNKEIKRIVFTEPHSPVFLEQTKHIILTIQKMFPDAEKIYSLHSSDNYLTKQYEEIAKNNGFIIKKCSHEIDKLDYYKECDLHIGYRVHGYISFLRIRKPAILIMEDGRGVGQGDVLKTGCINAFEEGHDDVVADMNLPEKLIKMINYHRETDFKDYNTTLNFIDKNYLVMRDFIKKSIN
jgi:hypothetical protein